VRTKNGVVDVTLIDPETNEVIPGLVVYTDATNRTYTLRNVPEGTFIAIASLANDDYVLDPDSVAKLGLPIVEVIDGEAYPYYSPVPDNLNFNITGAVMLTQPVNFQTLPANALVFTWDTTSSYSSAQDFTVEVTDESGNWVWGEKNPALTTPYTSLTATCDAALEEGKFYRVKVYANTKNNDGTYTVTSTSEDLEGIFKVGPNQ
jgi:hypothetical protein